METKAILLEKKDIDLLVYSFIRESRHNVLFNKVTFTMPKTFQGRFVWFYRDIFEFRPNVSESAIPSTSYFYVHIPTDHVGEILWRFNISRVNDLTGKNIPFFEYKYTEPECAISAMSWIDLARIMYANMVIRQLLSPIFSKDAKSLALIDSLFDHYVADDFTQKIRVQIIRITDEVFPPENANRLNAILIIHDYVKALYSSQQVFGSVKND